MTDADPADVQLVVAEIGVLVPGLVIGLLRTLRGPVSFPVRAPAIGHVDLFRGVPLLIAHYLIPLRLQGVPTDTAVLGTIMESGPPAQVLGDPQQPRSRKFLARVIA